MLKSLSIRNIVLIESAHLDFEGGLTVLTGETGAGKSAILKALALALGGRADTDLIRSGCDRARVEAAFSPLPEALSLLAEAGIEHEPGGDLIISRELPGRAFVNQQMVQTTFLKRLAATLLDVVGQSANIRLTTPSYPLETVDLYGKIDTSHYEKSYRRCQELEESFRRLTDSAEERAKREARLQAELEELTAAAPQEGEEETLFQEYSKLTHSEELAQKSYEAIEALDGEGGALTLLAQCQKALQRMGKLDPSHTADLEGVLVEVRDLTHTLRSYADRLQHNPERQEAIASRLALLERLKKRYGPDLVAYQHQIESELQQVGGGEERLAELGRQLQAEQARCTELAMVLTGERKKAAKILAEAACAHLRPLNLAKAEFEIEITPTPLSLTGGDGVEFLFAPNPGEGRLPVRKCASGGELSRLLLALKTALSGLERTPTLIFDEIDSGMGGETAVLVGQKLGTIATGRQVLCITHLAQVARQADHHFAIAKEEQQGRTLTTIRPVSGQARRDELTRMQGGTSLLC
ncbi:MAG: DNA repair protein RecN [Parachlamydiales bacterium]